MTSRLSSRPGAGPRFELGHCDQGMTLATWGSLVVMVFRDDLTPERVALMREHELSLVARQKTKFVALSLLDVTDAQIIRSSPEGREAATRLTREIAPHLLAAAIILDREGFVAALLRSMITTINVVAAPPYPMRVFSDIAQGLEWLETRLGSDVHPTYDRNALLEAIPALRRAHER